MAVTQYIGARYVPNFYEGEDGTPTWVSGVQYEPLTIVTYNGNSYTSKKPVPASVGNPSANPSYWASTGIYNEQVENLRLEFEEFRTDVSEQVDTLESNVQTLENETEMKLTEICWFGDSYVQASSLGTSQNKRFSTLVSEALGLTEHNYATGGSDFLSGGDSGLRYSDQLTSAENDLTENQKNRTKFVIVGGTRNMPYNSPNASLSDYNTAISNWYARARLIFPNATLVFIPMLWSSEALPTVYQRTVQWCMQCGLNLTTPTMVIDKAWLWLMGRFGDIMADGVHPNLDGHRLIATHVYNAITGTNIIAAPVFWDFTINGGTGALRLKVIDGVAYLNGTFSFSSAQASGVYVVNQTNIGNNFGFIIQGNFNAVAIAGDGSTVTVQISNYHQSNNINFAVRLASACDANKTYTLHNVMMLNGIEV